MTKTLIYFFMIFLVFSCKSNSIDKPDKPDNLISKDSMVEIIYDMSLMSSAKGSNKYILESKGVIPEDYIFKRHNIDSLQFALSNEYYAYNLKTYEDIYTKIKAKLKSDQAHFDTIVKEEQKITDSISLLMRKELDSTRKIKQASKLNRTTIKRGEKQDRLIIVDSSQ